MTYPKATVKQSDLTRYAKAMRAAGFEDVRFEIEPSGKVVILTSKPEDRAGVNPCDRLLKGKNATLFPASLGSQTGTAKCGSGFVVRASLAICQRHMLRQVLGRHTMMQSRGLSRRFVAKHHLAL